MSETITARVEPDHAGLRPLPPSMAELTSLRDAFARQGVESVSLGYPELFSLDDRLLKIDEGSLFVFRHEDLRRLGPDHRVWNLPLEVFLGRQLLGPPEAPLTEAESDQIWRFQSNQFFTTMPQTHAPTKRIFATPLMPKGMPPFAAIADRLAQSLVREFAGVGRMDVVSDYALAVAVGLWGDVFEMTPAERKSLSDAVATMAPIFTGEVKSRQSLVDMNSGIRVYLDVLVSAMERVQAKGDHFLLTWMAQQFANLPDPLPGKPDSVESATAANLIDGFHAMAMAIANTVYYLLENPDALAAVRLNPELAAKAVDEALRLSSPVPMIQRRVVEDVDYDGLRIPAGTLVLFHWGAGNRDPSVHERPNAFDLNRVQQALTTFGSGAQICPGRNLARTVGAAGVRALIAEGVSLSRSDEVEWHPGNALMSRSFPTRLAVDLRID